MAHQTQAPDRAGSLGPDGTSAVEHGIVAQARTGACSSATSPEARPIEPVPTCSDSAIDQLASEILHLIRGRELQCAFEVGQLVAERVFGGDRSAWHGRRHRDVSLAKLAERLRSRGIRSASAVHRCLMTYEVLAPLGAISTWKYLSPSHVRAVHPLPPAAREPLLRRAESAQLTVREIEVEAAATAGRSRLGRPRTADFTRTVRKLHRIANDVVNIGRNPKKLLEMSDATRLETYTELVSVIEMLDRQMHLITSTAVRSNRSDGGPGHVSRD